MKALLLVLALGCAPKQAADPAVYPTKPGEPAARVTHPGDLDGDGILDGADACVDLPEDRDGVEDDDGCPDPDNDRDGIPDESDKCPNEPEVYNGKTDDDGCPP